MPSSFETSFILIIAVLPGATFVWALERAVGKWDFGVSDRVLRFVVFSALMHLPVFPLTMWIVDGVVSPDSGLRSVTLQAWGLLVAFVLGSALLGDVVGRGARRRRRWTEFFTGRDPAPRAWDNLFVIEDQVGWIRLRLKSGPWIAGAWANDPDRGIRSYASGHPHPTDLYLAEVASVDPKDGSFELDAAGNPVLRDVGVLVRWDEVEYLEFIRG